VATRTIVPVAPTLSQGRSHRSHPNRQQTDYTCSLAVSHSTSLTAAATSDGCESLPSLTAAATSDGCESLPFLTAAATSDGCESLPSLATAATSDGCESLLQRLVDGIMGSKGMSDYDRVLGYCDTDTSDEDQYTVG
jgi:hypothetical protein